MNAKNGYELHIAARRERATLQGELLVRFVTALAKRAGRAWFNVSGTCRRHLRAFRIAEA